MKYIEVNFDINPVIPFSEILMAELSDVGFDSFVENENGLQAYVPEKDFSTEKVENILSLLRNCKISYTYSEMPDQDWNATWEATNQPVMIDNLCWVYPPNFEANSNVRYNIIINPKMSFGTAHHPTTYMLLKMLAQEQLCEQKVLDMGTGTGVLAILAEQKSASYIEAIDIDEWAYNNVLENIASNGCTKIKALLGDASLLTDDKNFDVVIANINKNILIADMHCYSKVLTEHGTLFLSGFYEDDLADISTEATKYGLQLSCYEVRENWTVAKFTR